MYNNNTIILSYQRWIFNRFADNLYNQPLRIYLVKLNSTYKNKTAVIFNFPIIVLFVYPLRNKNLFFCLTMNNEVPK